MPAWRGLTVGIVSAAVAVLCASDGPPAVKRVDYARDVKPILEKYCYDCHGPKQQLSGLRLDRKDSVRLGGFSGQIIIPGDGEGSRIFRMVGGVDGMPMPIGDPKPTKAEVEVIRAWIDQGAVWPDDPAPARSKP
jgi:Planctomycete cytochrome C